MRRNLDPYLKNNIVSKCFLKPFGFQVNYFVQEVPGVLEVSIGHALISEALYFGLQNVVSMYLQKLK